VKSALFFCNESLEAITTVAAVVGLPFSKTATITLNQRIRTGMKNFPYFRSRAVKRSGH